MPVPETICIRTQKVVATRFLTGTLINVTSVRDGSPSAAFWSDMEL
jgi:hypothetical protein